MKRQFLFFMFTGLMMFLMQGVACAAENSPKAESRSLKSSVKADYLLITCIDFRLRDEVCAYMSGRGLGDQYDELVIPGVALGVDKYESWKKAFFSQLDIIKKLHGIKTVMLLEHRDCGMYSYVFGKDVVGTGAHEADVHLKEMQKFKQEILKRHPDLKVELLLMAVDGKVETL